MLVQLTIADFAIIHRLETPFKEDLNILSGETGAGKSIIINAVNLILGARASADLIRTGCREAKVEALFSLPENSSIQGLMRSLDIPFEGELLIKRTISREEPDYHKRLGRYPADALQHRPETHERLRAA